MLELILSPYWARYGPLNLSKAAINISQCAFQLLVIEDSGAPTFCCYYSNSVKGNTCLMRITTEQVSQQRRLFLEMHLRTNIFNGIWLNLLLYDHSLMDSSSSAVQGHWGRLGELWFQHWLTIIMSIVFQVEFSKKHLIHFIIFNLWRLYCRELQWSLNTYLDQSTLPKHTHTHTHTLVQAVSTEFYE